MNIHLPWTNREQNGQSARYGRDFRARRKYHADLDVAKRPQFLVEDDLDHLGMFYKKRH